MSSKTLWSRDGFWFEMKFYLRFGRSLRFLVFFVLVNKIADTTDIELALSFDFWLKKDNLHDLGKVAIQRSDSCSKKSQITLLSAFFGVALRVYEQTVKLPRTPFGTKCIFK